MTDGEYIAPGMTIKVIDPYNPLSIPIEIYKYCTKQLELSAAAASLLIPLATISDLRA
jgi:hypothetical protein